MRAPIASRRSTPSAIAIRRIEPNRLMPTGYAEIDPFMRTGFSNSSAGPPPSRFITRSAISVSSRFTETGSRTRTSSPARSNSCTKAARVSMVTGKS